MGVASRKTLRVDLTFDPGLPLFADHFPGQPLVPAFLQMHRVGECVAGWLGVEPGRIKVRTAKFLRPLEPGVAVALVVEPRGDMGGVFALSVSGEIVTQGELTLA